MNYLVDTNILTRIADPTRAMHQEALDAVQLLCRISSRIRSNPVGRLTYLLRIPNAPRHAVDSRFKLQRVGVRQSCFGIVPKFRKSMRWRLDTCPSLPPGK
jgi:hypothetical protein